MKNQDAALKADFGKRLRELRKARGLSQEALAHACDLDRTYVAELNAASATLAFRYRENCGGARRAPDWCAARRCGGITAQPRRA